MAWYDPRTWNAEDALDSVNNSVDALAQKGADKTEKAAEGTFGRAAGVDGFTTGIASWFKGSSVIGSIMGAIARIAYAFGAKDFARNMMQNQAEFLGENSQLDEDALQARDLAEKGITPDLSGPGLNDPANPGGPTNDVADNDITPVSGAVAGGLLGRGLAAVVNIGVSTAQATKAGLATVAAKTNLFSKKPSIIDTINMAAEDTGRALGGAKPKVGLISRLLGTTGIGKAITVVGIATGATMGAANAAVDTDTNGPVTPTPVSSEPAVQSPSIASELKHSFHVHGDALRDTTISLLSSVNQVVDMVDDAVGITLQKTTGLDTGFAKRDLSNEFVQTAQYYTQKLMPDATLNSTFDHMVQQGYKLGTYAIPVAGQVSMANDATQAVQDYDGVSGPAPVVR